MKMKLGIGIFILVILGACRPAAEGPSSTDPRAMALADSVMEALGGEAAWQNTRFLSWRFFGRRRHYWDKAKGDIRVEAGKRLILMNLNSREGRAWVDGEEIVAADSLKKLIDRGYRMWVNDSYWLFMPFKLKDPGVSLAYLGRTLDPDSSQSHCLELTFDGVGVTPQNKYHVWVNPESHLVTGWSYFKTKNDSLAQFANPWRGWETFGTIKLSADRGRGQHTDIAVYTELPASVFGSPGPVNLAPTTNKE